MVNWEATKEEYKLVEKIVAKAIQKYPQLDTVNLEMDIMATHLNGCNLKLQEFLDAGDFNFAHDIFGIVEHMNRKTGKLENCFLPRYSL